jgi:hypothetical protein
MHPRRFDKKEAVMNEFKTVEHLTIALRTNPSVLEETKVGGKKRKIAQTAVKNIVHFLLL